MPALHSLLLSPRARKQLGLFVLAYLVYSAARWITIGDLDTARGHAEWIVGVERDLGVAVESGVQSALSGTAVLWVLNHLYLAAQLLVLPGALIFLYRRNRRLYATLRNTIIATWLVSIPVYALFPVAPPRLADMGLVDTITSQTGFSMDSKLTTSFYNELAAVPSLHVGFAVAIGIAVAAAVRSRAAKTVALLWGPIVGLAVVATGNHFVFDIAAGVVASAAGYALGALAARAARAARPSSTMPRPRHMAKQIAMATTAPVRVRMVLVPTKKSAS
jgi:membrane-associated phospholipid phosphatase